MSKTTVVVSISVICIFVIALLVLFVVMLQNDANDNDLQGGLLYDPNDDPHFGTETEEIRQGQYESKTEMPASTIETMDQVIPSYLSRGEFDALDDILARWIEDYKDSPDQSEDEMAVVQSCRADIQYLTSLKTSEPLNAWYFENPETLAAAVAYLPVSVKYAVFKDRNSALMSPAKKDVQLRKTEGINDELKTRLAQINFDRGEADKASALTAYDMTISGHECRLYIVRDKNYFFEPYSLEVLNEDGYDITCALADSIIAGDENANLDAVFITPDRTDFGTST